MVSLQLNPVYSRWELALTKQNYKSTATTKPNKTCCFIAKNDSCCFILKKAQNCKVTACEVSSWLLSDHVFFYGSGTSSGFVPKSTYPKESPEILGFRPFYSKLSLRRQKK